MKTEKWSEFFPEKAKVFIAINHFQNKNFTSARRAIKKAFKEAQNMRQSLLLYLFEGQILQASANSSRRFTKALKSYRKAACIEENAHVHKMIADCYDCWSDWLEIKERDFALQQKKADEHRQIAGMLDRVQSKSIFEPDPSQKKSSVVFCQ